MAKPRQPSKSMEALIATSEASYRAGLALCRPGVTLRELEAAMEAPCSDGGHWHLAPLYHDLSPMILQGTTGRNVSADMPGLRACFYGGQDAPVYHQFGGDFVLREGMLIHLEPNGRRGNDSVFLGMNVLIIREGRGRVQGMNSNRSWASSAVLGQGRRRLRSFARRSRPKKA